MKNQKDRFREKQFVERAEEDFYFAAKDRELIEETKAHLQKVEAAAREERAQTCPKCSGRFESYGFMEFVLDRCKTCEGIWLNKGQLELILKRATRGPLGAFLDRYFSKFDRKLSI
jgi:Zn-finger nucleic acid-binding protein